MRKFGQFILRSLCLLTMVVFSISASAQSGKQPVSGVVKSDAGEPIVGATIIVEATNDGTMTDLDGAFEIEATSEDAIVVSYIGYQTVKLPVGNRTNFEVTLAEDRTDIDAVVVVGYGVQRKVDLTGSVEVVSGDDMAKQPVFQASQALIGMTPGLTAMQSSGEPGGDSASLFIRGVGSMSADSNPLVLIDGVEGDINTIDSSDIESVSVLKDAGASAIYGSRASNGVILITTQRAKEGLAKVNYNGYFGVQNPTNLPNPVGAIDYLTAVNDQLTLEDYKTNGVDRDLRPDTDWVDLLFSENGFMQYHNVSVSGGSEAVRAKASVSYQNQDGNIKHYNFERYQGRLNTDFKINKKLSVQVDLNYSKGNKQGPAWGGGLISSAVTQLPTTGYQYSDGRWVRPAVGGNAIADLNNTGKTSTESTYMRSVFKATYNPIKQIAITAQYSPEFVERYVNTFVENYEAYSTFDSTTPVIWGGNSEREDAMTQQSSRSNTDNFTATIGYNDTFNSKHNFGVLGGYEFIKYRSEYFKASRYGYPLDSIHTINAGNADNDSTAGGADHNGLVSFFARANYNFDDRYLLTANIRRDGSSRFHKDNRWGTFPSVSAGWNIHNESFFPKQDVVNSLKLRASWGQLGNQSIGDSFAYASLMEINGSGYYDGSSIQQSVAQGDMSNLAISWETSETTNIGVDFSMLDNRLTGSAEYYIRDTKDLLGSQQIPTIIGLDWPTANVYSMRNQGVDVSLKWKHKVGDFTYSIGGNIATLHNEVTDLNGLENLKSATTINQIGSPVGSIYGYESVGIFANQDEIDAAPKQFGVLTPGDIQFKDQLTVDTNGDGKADAADGVINEDDRVILGNPFPELSFGINIDLSYKGFDLSCFFEGVGNRDVRLQSNLVLPLLGGSTLYEWQLKESWSADNLDAKFPVIKPYTNDSNNAKINSTYVFDASYLRMRNLTLGYNIPKTALEKIRIQSCRVYVSGQNMLTLFSKMPEGIEPTVANNASATRYPSVVTYTVGLNIGF